MKKILLSVVLTLCASTAFAAQQEITYIGDVKWKIAGKRIHENFTDLYTNKEPSVYVGETAPADTTRIFLDSNEEAGVLVQKKYVIGTGWVRVGSHGVQYTSSCASITAGMCVDTDDGKLYYHNNTSVVEVGSGGSVDLSAYLSKTNTTPFTPSGDYHPATKKYVDDSITAGGGYTDEQAQDAAGAMVAGNTETGIAVTYDDTAGKFHFIVATQSDVNFTSAKDTKLSGIATGAEVNVNADWNSSSGDSQILNKPPIPTVSTLAYNQLTWNASNSVPDQNAIRDYMVNFDSDGDGDFTDEPWFPSGSSFDPANPGPFGGNTPSTGVFTTITAGEYLTSAVDGNRWSGPINTVAITATPSLGRIAWLTDRYWLANGTNWTSRWLIDSSMIGVSGGVQGYNADLTSASGASTAGVSKYWGTNASSVVGFYDLPSGAGTPTTITVADTTDTTSYVALFTDATGDLGPKTDAGLTYNAGTGMLTATGLTGPLTGIASGNPVVIASGAYTVDTASVPANTCATPVSVTATGTATTDRIVANPNARLSTIAGFGVTSAGAVRVDVYPTVNNVNFEFCNPTGTAIDPGSVTFNWSVIR